MHMTRLPGFSAEASLSPSSAVYQVDPLSRVLGQRRKGGVQPARIKDYCNCFDRYGETCCCCSIGWGEKCSCVGA